MSSGRPSYPHVHQISVSDGGVPKKPVLAARVTEQGVEGDRQRNLKLHGGADRAVCLFSLELIERLQDEGHPIEPGFSGENLTLAGQNAPAVEIGPSSVPLAVADRLGLDAKAGSIVVASTIAVGILNGCGGENSMGI